MGPVGYTRKLFTGISPGCTHRRLRSLLVALPSIYDFASILAINEHRHREKREGETEEVVREKERGGRERGRERAS